MTIDIVNFTPVPSLVGGMLIGISSILMLNLFGRIAGISGIVGGVLEGHKNDTLWRMAFLLGILVSPIVFSNFVNREMLSAGTQSNLNLTNVALAIVAGLLVGFGTRLGSGCTSGHGICGISRLSSRSIVATVTFLLAGVVTVFIFNIFK